MMVKVMMKIIGMVMVVEKIMFAAIVMAMVVVMVMVMVAVMVMVMAMVVVVVVVVVTVRDGKYNMIMHVMSVQ